MAQKTTIRIFGVPMDLGQERRGVDMGPSAVRYAGLQDRLERLGYEVHDQGNIAVPLKEEVLQTERRAEPRAPDLNAHHVGAVIEVCTAIYTQMTKNVHPGEFAIFLGGDHSISIGTVSAVASRGKHGIIWVDAHADYNTPDTSPSGNIHGMPVAALLGEGIAALTSIGGKSPKLEPSQVVMVGIRDLDVPERERLGRSGIGVFTMTDIDEHGMGLIARRVLDRLSQFDTIHVSLDMDSLDPEEAPGVGTPVRGGLSYREAHLLMEVFAQSGKVRSLDIVEVNPILDQRNQTAELAVGLAASLLGKRIL